jgi:hypothetical protein
MGQKQVTTQSNTGTQGREMDDSNDDDDNNNSFLQE